MSKIIYGIEKLQLSEEEEKNLKDLIIPLRRIYTLNFTIVGYHDDYLFLKVRQRKPLHENAIDKSAISKMAKEAFAQIFPEAKIRVESITYRESPVDVVTPEWIQKKITGSKTRLKDIVEATGMDKSYLSSLINGKKPLSQLSRAFFYYYFKS